MEADGCLVRAWVDCPSDGCSNRAEFVGGAFDLECLGRSFERRMEVKRGVVFRCAECGDYVLVRSSFLRLRASPVSPEASGELDFLSTSDQQARGLEESSRRRRERHERQRQTGDRLEAEIRAGAGKTVQCPDCGRKFVTDADRDSHARAKHG